MTRATVAYELHDGLVMLSVHRREQPSDAEWDEYVAECGRLIEVDPTGLRAFVITEGGGPTVDQRRRMNEMLAGRPAKTAIVSDSIMIRGIVTAMSWWNPLIRSFRKPELAEAFGYLDLPSTRIGEILGRLNALRAQIDLPPLAAPGGPTNTGPTKAT